VKVRFLYPSATPILCRCPRETPLRLCCRPSCSANQTFYHWLAVPTQERNDQTYQPSRCPSIPVCVSRGGVGEGAIPLSIGYSDIMPMSQGDAFALVLPSIVPTHEPTMAAAIEPAISGIKILTKALTSVSLFICRSDYGGGCR
jgi:hypothetical protein